MFNVYLPLNFYKLNILILIVSHFNRWLRAIFIFIKFLSLSFIADLLSVRQCFIFSHCSSQKQGSCQFIFSPRIANGLIGRLVSRPPGFESSLEPTHNHPCCEAAWSTMTGSFIALPYQLALERLLKRRCPNDVTMHIYIFVKWLFKSKTRKAARAALASRSTQ